MWPYALSQKIDKYGVEGIHIAFEKAPIWDAINRFTVNGQHLPDGRSYYLKKTDIDWG